jgi:glycosyltransferase involved in cell wall biosynthesis
MRTFPPAPGTGFPGRGTVTNGQPSHRYAPPGARGVELRDQPSRSVVIVSRGSSASLQELLASARLKALEDEEVLVVRCATHGDLADLAAARPDVRFVATPDDDPRTLRVTGVTHATGAVVRLVTDDADALTAETGGQGDLPRPLLSVIVPAHKGEGVLDRTLGAIVASDLARESWELVVVDDASTDRTELVAAVYADVIVRLAGNPHGPAYARNRGAEESRGGVLAFVDADVTVHPDALRRILSHLVDPGAPAAVFGSYDVMPSSDGIPSQYRNLLHHFVHLHHAGPAETFWSGLGAVRATVFRDVGMFDEWHYSRPQIEDIELGRRLRSRGHRILLDPTIQGTHLKHWTLWSIFATDFKHRGVPWMWLILHEGAEAESQKLNVGRVEQFCTAVVGLALVSLAAALVLWSTWPLLIVAAAFVIVAATNLPFYWYLRRHRSLLFSIAVLPLHLSYYVVNVVAAGAGWVVYQFLGAPSPPPARQAAAQVGVRSWPPAIQRPSQTTWAPRPTRAKRTDRHQV